MTSLTCDFGFFPNLLVIASDQININTRDDFEKAVSATLGSTQVVSGWYYAAPAEILDIMSGRVTEQPYTSRVFGLPHTHSLTHANADGPAHLEFLLWCLSFFAGLRLTSREVGYLDATPVHTGRLVDFVCGRSWAEQALMRAEAFWQMHKGDRRTIKRIEGIVHALFLSQAPQSLAFERFFYLYMALDACFALTASIVATPTGHLTHAARLDWMCRQFGMSTPPWAQTAAGQGTEVSLIRNDTLHEALFFEEPLGFSPYEDRSADTLHVPLQMQALTCRLLVALLGVPDTDYVCSTLDSRSTHWLNLA